MKLDLKKEQLTVGEWVIPCHLIRSDRRSLGFEMRRCLEDGVEFLIRAPKRMRLGDIEQLIHTKEQWITEKYLKILGDNVQKKTLAIPDYVTQQWLKTEGVRKFQEKIAFWADRMQMTYGKVTIRDQKTRWGSCSSRGNLNFNWRLLLMPEAIMDYVIVHELAHRREMNHSAAFWQVVETYMPDYRDRLQWLKENGGLYLGPINLS